MIMWKGKRSLKNSLALLIVFRRSFEAISLIIFVWRQKKKYIQNKNCRHHPLHSLHSFDFVEKTKVKMFHVILKKTFRSLMRLLVAVVVTVDTSFSLISSSSCWFSLHMFNTWTLLDWTLSVLAVLLFCSQDRDVSVQTQKSKAEMHCSD